MKERVFIDGTTKLLGLLGNPVEHSVSPVLHGTLASMHQDNYAYLAFKVEEERLGDAVNGAFALGAAGLNVTVPYKKAVMQYLCEIDKKAEVIGAVNTLVRTETGYKGYNTDMPGLFRAMNYDGITLDGKNVVVIGAGGVANAVLGMLFEAKVKSILVLNRTKERAEVLVERFKAAYKDADILVRTASYDEDYLSIMDEMNPSEGGWIAIQATSVGMSPVIEAAAIENTAFYRKVETGYDLIFNPYETKFMRLVKEQGGKSFNGLRMLLFQGIYAYELWNGISIPDEWAEPVLDQMKEAMGINE
ncbi:MAG: shikimate dehydrogenase [Lachnospiraceae bacterium]